MSRGPGRLEVRHARRWRGAAMFVLAVLLACEDAGPAEYLGIVEGEAAAAVVVLRGEGISGVDAVGSTRVFAERQAGSSTGVPSWRVVLVAPVSGPLRFRVLVQDGSRPVPSGGVIEASDGANQPRSTLGLTVRFEGS